MPDSGKGIGGAVFNLSGAFTAVGTTITANTAAYDGTSIYNLVYDSVTARTAQTTLRNTIVSGAAGSFALASSKPQLTFAGFNLGSASAAVGERDLVRTMHAVGTGTISGSPLTADPQLGPLQANGGPTRTMAPASASPVVDKGSAFGLTTDQRGLSRPFDLAAIANAGDGSDIGAVELPLTRPASGGGVFVPSFGTSVLVPSFGTRTLITLRLAARRIPSRGPLRIRVANRNGFAITGRLGGKTVRRVEVSRRRRVALRAKTFRVAAQGRRTVRLRLPRALRRLLRRSGRLSLLLTAKVKDPAGHTRTVRKRVSPRLKKPRRR